MTRYDPAAYFFMIDEMNICPDDFDDTYYYTSGGCDEGYGCEFCSRGYENNAGCCIYCYGCGKVCCPTCAIFAHNADELVDYHDGESETYKLRLGDDLDIIYNYVNGYVDDVDEVAKRHGFKVHKNASKTAAEIVGRYYYCPDCARNDSKYYISREVVLDKLKSKYPDIYNELVEDKITY